MIAYDSTGNSTGVDIYQPTSSEGFFANDKSGVTRNSLGLSLDDTSWASLLISDSNNKPRLSMGDFSGSAKTGLFVLDGAGTTRTYDALSSSGALIGTQDVNGNLTGHIP